MTKYKLNSIKILADKKLDDIKGFVTNDFILKENEVIEHYSNQYAVEQAL